MILVNNLQNMFFLFFITTTAVIICGASFYEIKIQENCSNIYNSLKSVGFCEIGNHAFLQRDYNELYKNFDSFIDTMNKDKNVAIKVYDLEKEFLSNDSYKKRYCSAPPSYRDPREYATKRFNKIYFQFIKEHHDLICEKHPDLLSNNSDVNSFLKNMESLDAMARELFTEIIDSLEQSRPGFKAILYGDHKELTIISKIVRYEETVVWGTTPHCDKSSITLIWNSNDDSDESLLLCEDMENPRIYKIKKPQRFFSGKNDVTSTILISGTACSKVGIDLHPTVHGVAPITKKYRHAVISFLLIPDIDMSDIVSDFIEPSQ